MSDSSGSNIDLKLTDEEFVAIHAAASAKGLEVNEFIVATLRQHAQAAMEIEETQENTDS